MPMELKYRGEGLRPTLDMVIDRLAELVRYCYLSIIMV